MPDPTTYGLFVLASLALLLVPGPAIFYVVARGVEGGTFGRPRLLPRHRDRHAIARRLRRRRALRDSGFLSGAFTVVKWLGAAYLVYLGLKKLFGGDEDDGPVAVEPEPMPRVLLQGVLVQVLNPKVALFFLAFLPQFVDPSRGPVWAQILVLGATLGVLGFFTDGAFALLGGTAGNNLRSRGTGLRRAGRYLTGGVYLALGAASAASGSGKG